jgi:hypothetical protein
MKNINLIVIGNNFFFNFESVKMIFLFCKCQLGVVQLVYQHILLIVAPCVVQLVVQSEAQIEVVQ